MANDGRVFSEQDLGEIIQRASELQERAGESAAPYAAGVTLEQLERVAQEVGVEPAFLQQALEERARPARPSRAVHERVVEGELDPADFDLFLEEVRGHRRRNDDAKQIGRTLVTQAWSGPGIAQVEVTSRNERTRLKVKAIPAIECAVLIPLTFLGGLFPAVFLGTHGHAGLAGAVVGGTVATAAGIFGLWHHRSRRAAGRLADKLEGVLRRVVADTAPEAARASQETAEVDRRAAAARRAQEAGR